LSGIRKFHMAFFDRCDQSKPSTPPAMSRTHAALTITGSRRGHPRPPRSPRATQAPSTGGHVARNPARPATRSSTVDLPYGPPTSRRFIHNRWLTTSRWVATCKPGRRISASYAWTGPAVRIHYTTRRPMCADVDLTKKAKVHYLSAPNRGLRGPNPATVWSPQSISRYARCIIPKWGLHRPFAKETAAAFSHRPFSEGRVKRLGLPTGIYTSLRRNSWRRVLPASCHPGLHWLPCVQTAARDLEQPGESKLVATPDTRFRPPGGRFAVCETAPTLGPHVRRNKAKKARALRSHPPPPFRLGDQQ